MQRARRVFGCALITLSLFLPAEGVSQSDGDVVFNGGATFPNLFAVVTTDEGVLFVAREPDATCGIPYHVQRFGEDPAVIALISDPPPRRNCRGKLSASGTALFSYEELGLELGETFQVLNPIEASGFDFVAFFQRTCPPGTLPPEEEADHPGRGRRKGRD